jgi:hypothetical protein
MNTNNLRPVIQDILRETLGNDVYIPNPISARLKTGQRVIRLIGSSPYYHDSLFKRGVAVAVAVLAGGGDQAIDFGVGQILAGANLGVSFAARRAPAIANCPNNGGWRHQRQLRFCHDFSGLSSCYCPEYGRLRDTAQGQKC